MKMVQGVGKFGEFMCAYNREPRSPPLRRGWAGSVFICLIHIYFVRMYVVPRYSSSSSLTENITDETHCDDIMASMCTAVYMSVNLAAVQTTKMTTSLYLLLVPTAVQQ